MNLRRRLQVVAGAVAACGAAGAGAGMALAALMLTARVGHLGSGFVWELIKLGTQSGAAFGVIVGPPIVLGFLRRVPIRRIATDTLVGLLYGGLTGYAMSLPFAQPRPVVPLMIVGSCVGFAAAALRLWAQYRERRASTAVPLVG